MTQVAKPSLLDGKVLSVELTRQFPEVPRNIIMDIMEKNSNNRELCFEALSRVCQRYQHHLYGVPSPEEKKQDEDPAKDIGVVFPWTGSQAGIGSWSSNQCSGQLEEAVSRVAVGTARLPQERPSVFHPPHATYTPPIVTAGVVSSPVVDAVTSQRSVASPVTCPPPPIIFTTPYHQTYGVGDQILYPAASHKAASGASVTGRSFVGAFADKPQNVDPGYGFLHSPSVMMNPSRSGARSPLPTPGQHHPAYPAEPFQSMSTIPFLFNRSPSGSCGGASVGSPFHNQPDALTVYRRSLSRENLAANIAAMELSSNSSCQPGAPLSCSGSGCSSRSGSLAGEDVTYIQALLIYQKARLEAFLVDLNQQKETLDVLRSEVGQLQQRSLDRRLCRNDTFPTAVDRQKLLTENQNLQMEIHLLTYEIDIANNGQTRLGWLDSEADQRFHDVIPPGQFNPFWPVTVSQNLHVLSYSSTPVVSPPRQSSIMDNRVPQPLRPTRPPPPPPPYSAPKATDPDDGERWNCSACTFLNHPLLNKCEFCEMPKLPAATSGLR